MPCVLLSLLVKRQILAPTSEYTVVMPPCHWCEVPLCLSGEAVNVNVAAKLGWPVWAECLGQV